MYFIILYLCYLILQVILRAREAEMQFLRQEARALREELKVARMVLKPLETSGDLARLQDLITKVIFRESSAFMLEKHFVFTEINGRI